MHAPEVRARAKLLNDRRYNPKRIIDFLEEEFGFRISDRTLRKWAKDDKWKPWRDGDLQFNKDLNPNKPAGVSGIDDPIFHLSEVLGRRLVRENPYTRSGNRGEYGSSRLAIALQALEEVNRQYEPGRDTLDYLKPKLMDYVSAMRKSQKPNYLNEDPMSDRQSRQLLKDMKKEVPDEE